MILSQIYLAVYPDRIIYKEIMLRSFTQILQEKNYPLRCRFLNLANVCSKFISSHSCVVFRFPSATDQH